MSEALSSESIAANTGWRIAGSLGRLGMQIVWTVCLSRWLTPGDFGIVAYAMLIVGFADLASQLGVGPALVQKQELTDDGIRAGFTLSLMMGAIACFCLFVLAPWVATGDVTTTRVIRVLSTVFFVMGVNVVSGALLQRQHRFKDLVVAECSAYFIGYVCVSVGLALIYRSVWCIVAGMLTNQALRSLFNWCQVRHSLVPLFNWHEMRSLLKFGLVFTVTKILNYGANTSDVALTRNWFGEGPLGLYSRAFMLVRLPASLATRSMHAVLFPAFSRIPDRDRIRSAYYKATMFGLCLMVPLCCTALVTAPEMVVVPFGAKWQGAVIPLQILAPVAFLGIYTLGDAVLKAINRLRVQMMVHASYFIMVILLVAVFSTYIEGIIGVALGVLAANIVMYLQMAIACARCLNGTLRGFLWLHVPAALIGIVVLTCGVGSRFFMVSLDCAPWLIWLCVLSSCVIAFLAVSILPSHRVLDEYRALFSKFALTACAHNRYTSQLANRVFRFVG